MRVNPAVFEIPTDLKHHQQTERDPEKDERCDVDPCERSLLKVFEEGFHVWVAFFRRRVFLSDTIFSGNAKISGAHRALVGIFADYAPPITAVVDPGAARV